jgi:glucose-6-phosphate 1-dehydrogenase
MASATRFEPLDVTDPGDAVAFLADIDEAGRPIVLYFALPPAVSQKACEVLVRSGCPRGCALAIEKPFGSSLESAKAFNAAARPWCPRSGSSASTTTSARRPC